jgi:pimeloyl-ACP methyl ester carboxylesterase
VTTALHTTAYGEHGGRVVFLHGLFGQGRNWTGIAKALAVDHRVLLVDLPDHGKSAWTERFDFVEIADTIAASVREQYPSEPVALVGHSLGGKVAMVLALRHPEFVERLCVVDIAPVRYQRMSEFSGYIDALCGLDLEALTQRADADAALAAAVPNSTVRAFLLQNLRRDGDNWHWQPNLQGLKRDLSILGSWPEAELGSASYDGPVLWVGGANSDYITDDYTSAMDRRFPHNRRVTIKNAGHWLHSEQPEVFSEVLRRFLG